MKENTIATNFEPYKCVNFVQSIIVTHENKAILSTWFVYSFVKNDKQNIYPNIKRSGVFIPQLIRYARVSTYYKCFILRAARLSCKPLGLIYVRERMKSSLWKFYSRYRVLIKHYEAPPPFPKCYMTFWDMAIYSDNLHWSGISLNRALVTELDLITVFDVIILFREISMKKCYAMPKILS